MLAYVFWHEPETGGDIDRYEALLTTFHRDLAGVDVPGLIASSAFHLSDGTPWFGAGPVYEDRYLLDDSASLDRLDQAAVAAAMRSSHDAVAALAGDGVAGLYRRRRVGSEPGPGRSLALWLTKPRGAPYATFTAELEEAAPDGSEIWQRQMVLGPTPEFCIIGQEDGLAPDGFPTEWSPVAVRRRRLFRFERSLTAHIG